MQIGLDRVDDVRALDGTPDTEVRPASERAAEAEGATRTPAQWVREYTRRAAALLKEMERAGDGSAAVREARATLTGIVRRIDPKETMGYAREVLGPLDRGMAQLPAARGEDHTVVVELCSRAICIIAYEDQKAFGGSWAPQEVRRQGTWDDPEYDEDVPAKTSQHFGGPKGLWRFQAARAGRNNDIERGRDDYDRERKP